MDNNISQSRILYNSYRFSAANTARVSLPGLNRGQLTQDGRMDATFLGLSHVWTLQQDKPVIWKRRRT